MNRGRNYWCISKLQTIFIWNNTTNHIAVRGVNWGKPPRHLIRDAGMKQPCCVRGQKISNVSFIIHMQIYDITILTYIEIYKYDNLD